MGVQGLQLSGVRPCRWQPTGDFLGPIGTAATTQAWNKYQHISTNQYSATVD